MMTDRLEEMIEIENDASPLLLNVHGAQFIREDLWMKEGPSSLISLPMELPTQLKQQKTSSFNTYRRTLWLITKLTTKLNDSST